MIPAIQCERWVYGTQCTRRSSYLRHFRFTFWDTPVEGTPYCTAHAAEIDPQTRNAAVRPLVLFPVGSESALLLEVAFDTLARLGREVA